MYTTCPYSRLSFINGLVDVKDFAAQWLVVMGLRRSVDSKCSIDWRHVISMFAGSIDRLADARSFIAFLSLGFPEPGLFKAQIESTLGMFSFRL